MNIYIQASKRANDSNGASGVGLNFYTLASELFASIENLIYTNYF